MGETEYRLSLVPLGGYVKLAGEGPEDEKSGASWEFFFKKRRAARLCFCGWCCIKCRPGLYCFRCCLSDRGAFITPDVGQVMPGWPAWEAGIQRGDKIVEIDGSKDLDFEDLFTIVALSNPATGVSLKVERDKKTFDVTVIPKYDEEHGIQRIGIMPATSLEIDKMFAFENNDAPARDAGIQVKDIVTAVNGKRISAEDEFREAEAMNPGKEISLTVLRDNKEVELKVTPSRVTRRMLGISCATAILDGVKNNSIASSAGLMKGDEVLEINSIPVTGFTDIRKFVADSKDDETCIFTVKRNNTVNLIEIPFKDEKAKEEFLGSLTPFYGLKVDSLVEGFPAEKIGLKPGDRITSLDEKEIKEWNILLQMVTAGQGKPMVIEWMRGNERFVSTIEPQKDEKSAAGRIGVKFREKTEVKQYGLSGSCVVGTKKAIINVQRLYLTLKGFFSNRLSTKNVGGLFSLLRLRMNQQRWAMVSWCISWVS